MSGRIIIDEKVSGFNVELFVSESFLQWEINGKFPPFTLLKHIVFLENVNFI